MLNNLSQRKTDMQKNTQKKQPFNEMCVFGSCLGNFNGNLNSDFPNVTTFWKIDVLLFIYAMAKNRNVDKCYAILGAQATLKYNFVTC